jgi:pimeloyl-ACP methyl ester carboxylesterase
MGAAVAPARTSGESRVLRVISKDGTVIAAECAGAGPALVVAHGGVGDRTRWTPMFPLLAGRLTVCAVDRRGRGASGDHPDYTLRKEAEDLAAVVEALPGQVALLGHSYGAICALEAAVLSRRITKLMLYEPPLREGDDLALVQELEALIARGAREDALVAFLRGVVRVPPDELQRMRAGPVWRSLVDSVHVHPRQMRALAGYRMDPRRLAEVTVPTLLIRGSETAVPDVKNAFARLMASLPHRTVAVLHGQHHNAMDTGREQLARVILDYVIGPPVP